MNNNICYIYESKLVCCFILKFEMLVAKAEDCNKSIFVFLYRGVRWVRHVGSELAALVSFPPFPRRRTDLIKDLISWPVSTSLIFSWIFSQPLFGLKFTLFGFSSLSRFISASLGIARSLSVSLGTTRRYPPATAFELSPLNLENYLLHSLF